jgi:hypothetical protein
MARNFASNTLILANGPVVATPLTLACWFNSTLDSTNQGLVAISNTNTNYFALIAGGAVAGDPLRASVNQAGSAASAESTTGYSVNTWHHACGVFSSSTSRSVYLDGGSSATNTDSKTPSSPSGLFIGAIASLNGLNMSGSIAEVGFWNAALTTEEIASLSKGITCDKVRPQSLVFYAPLIRLVVDVRGGRSFIINGTTVSNHPRIYP